MYVTTYGSVKCTDCKDESFLHITEQEPSRKGLETMILLLTNHRNIYSDKGVMILT